MTLPILRSRRAVICAAVLGVGSLCTTSWGASSWTFTGPTGAWQTASNWNGGVPNSSIDAIFNRNAGYNVTFSADAFTLQFLALRDGVTLQLAGHKLTAASNIDIGVNAGSGVTVDGGTFTQTSGTLKIGDLTVGYLDAINNGRFESAATALIGNTNGGGRRKRTKPGAELRA